MKKILISVLLSVFIVIGLNACNASNSILEDTKWFLRSYGEHNNLQAVIEDTEITATFDSSESEVSGSSGCNTYFASYEIDGNNLSISNLAWTEIACVSPAGVMEQEQEFLSLLAYAEYFQVDDTSLSITCSNGRYLYFKIISQ